MGTQLQKVKPAVFQKVLEKASKRDLIRQFGTLSVQSIIKDEYPTIGQLKRTYPVKQLEKVCSVILADLSESFNGELEDDDIEEISAELNSTMIFLNLTIEDVFLACRDIKSSDTFGKLSVNKVLSAFKKHFDKRSNLIQNKNENEHLSHKFSGLDERQQSQNEQKELDIKALARYNKEKAQKGKNDGN